MFKLGNKLKITEALCKSPNIATMLDETDRKALADQVKKGFDIDKFSRTAWERRMQASMDLALQLVKEKNFPWPGCANVAFPLITIAALQFHSRAYPILHQGPQIVKCRVPSEDPQGEKQKKADLVAKHMSWQRLEEDQPWEEQCDRGLIAAPILGCIFSKSYHHGPSGVNRSDLVLPQDLVMNYFAKSVEDCPRKTHVIPLYRNEIYSGAKSNSPIYLDVTNDEWYQAPPKTSDPPIDKMREDRRLGQQAPVEPDEATPYKMLEQHLYLDLDQDGYAEPYVATVEPSSSTLLRLVARFRWADVEHNYKEQVVRIKAEEMFSQKTFIPSPDGGVYGLGFGTLLGPNNEAVNSILNQLIDAGTLSNTSGGFLARGAKIRGGVYTFAPFEWKRVDSTGDDLKKSIFPLPVREPSAVLFNLLKLLIDYTNRISGTTEAMVGESTGQNTPAETSRGMIEQGMKIYQAVFKRMWRGYKAEFEKLYLLNGRYLGSHVKFGPPLANLVVGRELYLGDPSDICPEADPNIASDTMGLQQAEWVKQDSLRTPGYDTDAVTRFAHKKLHIENSELIFPGKEKIPPPPNPKVQVEQMRMQSTQLKVKADLQKFAAKLQGDLILIQAKSQELMAKAAMEAAQAQGVERGHKLQALQLLISAQKEKQDDIRDRIEQVLKLAEMLHGEPGAGGAGQEGGGGGVPGMAPSSLHEAISAFSGGAGGPPQG